MARKVVYHGREGFRGGWPASGGGGGGGVKFLEYTLTGADITAKSITLATPMKTLGQCQLNIAKGIAQVQGLDYVASALDTISWAGYLLDGILEAGDVLFLIYAI